MNRRKFFKDTLSAAAGAFAVSSFGCGSDVSGGRSAELRDYAAKIAAAHLEFMLPVGEWTTASAKPPRICVPIVCSSDDSYRMVSPNIAEIIRNGHTVRVSADRPLKIAATPKGRAFNHVSGFEAVPFYADSNKLEICVEVG